MTRFVFSLAFILYFSSSSLAAVVIVGYDTTNPNGTNPAAPDLPAAVKQDGVEDLDLARGPGLTPNAGATFNSSDWSLATSLDLLSGDYISWGWSASSVPWDLSTLDIEYDVSASGPTQLAIALSVNGGSFQTFFTDDEIEVNDEAHVGISLTQFTGVTSAEFRLFGFGPDIPADGRFRGPGGTLDIENIEPITSNNLGIIVSGNAVPEPGAGMVCFAACIALTGRRRRA
ncbi:MAG: hypothetical protein AB8B50_00750 [Pirellulaceae bacterium]